MYVVKMCNLCVGLIVGFGMVLNKDVKCGYCCIVEKCCFEMIEYGVL